MGTRRARPTISIKSYLILGYLDCRLILYINHMKRQINLHKRGRVGLLFGNLITFIKWPAGLLGGHGGIKLLAISLFALIILASLFLYGTYWYFAHDLPDLTRITGYRPHLTTEVYSIDGKIGRAHV